MARLIIGVLIGLVLGGVLTFFLFVGTPRSAKVPGVPIKPPDANGVPAGTAEVVLREDFFNNVLGTIFQQMNAPVFPLGGNPQQPAAATTDQQGCPSRITVLQQGSGVQTGVRFENNNLEAPLAFNGSYESPVGCLQFSGWAQARMDLRFDQATQSVFGQLTVETVNLDGINPFLSGLVTPIVQSSLNARVNPVKILDGRQLAVNMPIAAANGNLQAAVNDVRAEVKDNALNLFVNYDFQGAPLQPQN
jgi:hypothetical protein